MATAITKLHIYPQKVDYFCFSEHKISRGLLLKSGGGVLRTGFSRGKLQQCRSFRSEDGGGEREKGSDGKLETLKENEVKLKEGIGFWSAFKDSVFGYGSLSGEEYSKAVAKLEEGFQSIAVQIGRYIVTMMSTGVILATGFQLSGGDAQMDALIWYSWLGGIIIGTMIGANLVLDEHCRAGPRNVVITGSEGVNKMAINASTYFCMFIELGISTRGLGKALAREFLLSGDHVVVASRSAESVEMTVKELEENIKEGMISSSDKARKDMVHAKVVGIACDVCEPADVEELANFAISEFGSIDIWINNAGTNKGFRPLLQFSDEDIKQIVSTNLVGSILCTREAMRVMVDQPKGGHIFNMDGAGSGGSSTPLTAVYGSTKCGLKQLHASLLKESKRSKVGVHTASPGMVLTDLLLSGATLKNKQMFNFICELPETVARTLVPRMRVVKGTGKAINYLTPPRILFALVTAWLRQGRWFDDKGRALYSAEADRLRNWAGNRARFSFTDAMEMYTENTWVSVFSLSVVCAFIILSSTSNTFPGT